MNIHRHRTSGAIFILLSAVCFGSYGIWSRMMAGTFNDFFQGWTRALMILSILVPVGLMKRSFTRFSAREMPWVVSYAVPGSLVIPLYFYGFTALPIGTATLAFYAGLTMTGYILGAVIFGERMTPGKIVSLLLGIIGLLLVAGNRLSVSSSSLLPLLACVVAGVCGGTEVTLTKKLSDRHSPIQLTTTLYAITLIVCLIPDLIISKGHTPVPSLSVAWIGDIAHALASTAAFLLVVAGYAKTEAVVGSVIGLMEIPFGILFGLFLFREPVSVAVISGMVCIIGASLLPMHEG